MLTKNLLDNINNTLIFFNQIGVRHCLTSASVRIASEFECPTAPHLNSLQLNYLISPFRQKHSLWHTDMALFVYNNNVLFLFTILLQVKVHCGNVGINQLAIRSAQGSVSVTSSFLLRCTRFTGSRRNRILLITSTFFCLFVNKIIWLWKMYWKQWNIVLYTLDQMDC